MNLNTGMMDAAVKQWEVSRADHDDGHASDLTVTVTVRLSQSDRCRSPCPIGTNVGVIRCSGHPAPAFLPDDAPLTTTAVMSDQWPVS